MTSPLMISAARAADCPGHPDALGTARTIVVDPREHPRIGAMQYRETLPLRDHEVVLTFDDGPLPKYSNQVLQILNDQCVKATFFTIGRQAQANPEGVRKLAAGGHTIGTHSQNHPLNFNKRSAEQAKPEIDQGIASVAAALGDPALLSPFFRVPGLLHGEGVEQYAASQGLQVWSSDFLADDWRSVSGTKVYELAMQRLEARGKGILLLHDIHERTVIALPKILADLKARGFKIVHVVASTADRPATPSDPQDWAVHRPGDGVPMARWPAVPPFDFAASRTRSGATEADFAQLSSGWFEQTAPARQVAWPQPGAVRHASAAPALPVPDAVLFERPDPMPTAPSRRRLARVEAAKPTAKPVAEAKSAAALKPAERRVRVASLRKR